MKWTELNEWLLRDMRVNECNPNEWGWNELTECKWSGMFFNSVKLTKRVNGDVIANRERYEVKGTERNEMKLM